MIGTRIPGYYGYKIKGLTTADEIEIQDLCERCSDFFELTEGGKILRIGVIEDNLQGHKFWIKMGYIEVDRVKTTYRNKENTIIIMNSFLK
ncbi:hypothetical protein [Tissierella praeacuta]|uniref:hypothetical protein n=1 Tax=Tissierella praeacuta TaxID=43131 RepID=UPI00334241C3